MSGSEIPVLDHGFVRLDDSMADDLSVVNSARVSFASRSDYEYVRIGDECYCEDSTKQCDCFSYEKKLNDRDQGLISFLMKNRHGTPFEHNSFRFHVKAPLFVFREWQRHRISSYNEWSARYSKLENEFYLPDFEQIRIQTGKPGAYTFEQADSQMALLARNKIEEAYWQSWEAYEIMLEHGVAKEQARLVLPVAIYSQMYWTVNARSLMNFLSLRNSDQAMWEIREYAKVVEEIFKQKMPITAEAFVQNDRVAP